MAVDDRLNSVLLSVDVFLDVIKELQLSRGKKNVPFSKERKNSGQFYQRD